MTATVTWVVLTMGDRPAETAAALESIRARNQAGRILLVVNGGDPPSDVPDGVELIISETNLGVPGGRDLAARQCSSDVIAFLDDDALIMTSEISEMLEQSFLEPSVGGVSFRIVDEKGQTARRHVPRVGTSGVDSRGSVATFLGGACAIRRSAYELAGGYWPTLFYAHEELDLAWRMYDAGFRVDYQPQIEVFHPRTDVSRHTDGWRLTGRNRVLIARRNLPLPVAALHVLGWLCLGAIRAPDQTCRRAYLSGWRTGWRAQWSDIGVERKPIAWATIARLARLGRPPII